mgnify:CR=1 FL=1
MKQASKLDEACFVGHRSLYHFFHIFSKKTLTSNLRDEYSEYSYSSYSVLSSIPAPLRASLRSIHVPHLPQCFSPPL